MRHLIAALFILSFSTGCVVEDPGPEGTSPGTERGDAGANTGSQDGTVGQNTDAGTTGADASEALDADTSTRADASPPPPPPSEDGCERVCIRLEQCLYPACPALEMFSDDICGGTCQSASNRELNELADLDCDEFVEVFYEKPEFAEFCSEEDIPDECDEICETASQCGFDQPGCPMLCRDLDNATRACMLDADGDCGRFFECLENEEEDRPGRPSTEEVCGGICQREAYCIYQECAFGTLPDGYTRGCYESCLDNPPGGREIQATFQRLCPEVVESIREENPLIDERCDNNAEDACEVMCEDRVVPCGGIEREECVNLCRTWDDANNICILQSDDCREVNTCFGDDEGQELCRRQCDHFQTCMEEACPPRIIPPTLGVGCTADCLRDPPRPEEVEQWESLECRQVREIIYRGNRELRPLCEGNRDFRPGPEECVAFCDNALGECLGVGGRQFCLAGCSSLTREQYQCALEAQGDCMLIGECLNGPEAMEMDPPAENEGG